MNYEKAGDFEINSAVKDILFGEHWITESVLCKWDFNNPADAWPIIVENKINIDFQYGSWPTAEYSEYIYTDENPLRAAMIVFLMMQDHKEMDK
mgnify:CR=1 FL=1